MLLFTAMILATSGAAASGGGVHWPLDEGGGRVVTEVVSGTTHPLDFALHQARYQQSRESHWRRDCVVDGCLFFDGYSNRVDAAALPAELVADGFTASAWLAPHAFEWGDGGRLSAVMSQYDPEAKEGIVFGVYRHGAWGLRLGFGEESAKVLVSDVVLERDRWHHIAASWSPTTRTVALYFDGDKVHELVVPGEEPLRLPDRPLRLGSHSTPHTVAGIFPFNTYHGLADDLRIEPGVRSAAELQARIAAQLAPHGGAPPLPTLAQVTIPRSHYTADRHRPVYHLMPDAHWMNEPHAPLFFDGRYHLFFQKNPHGPFWHQIHWGHWVSDDLAHWHELPMALAPEPGNAAPDGVWSGSATLDANGEPVLFFTGGNDSDFPKERTGLAVPADPTDPDLLLWNRFPDPVLEQERGQGAWGQFRDPFVWRSEAGDKWFQLVTSGIPDGVGTALLFWSDDLLKWHYVGPILDVGRTYAYTGSAWELPVFLPVGDGPDGRPRWAFLFNAAGHGAVREVYHWVGVWDEVAMRFTPDHADPRTLDVGRDHFTGPSGFVDPEGRSILFTIAQGERTPQGEWESGWAHNAGLPVVLSMGGDGRLRTRPVDELARLRGEPLLALSGSTLADANAALANVQGDVLEVDLVLQHPGDIAEAVGLRLRRAPDDSERTDLRYLPADDRLEVDRTHTTLDPDKRSRGVQGGAVGVDEDILHFRVFLDRSMVEAWLNDRRQLTTRVFPARADSLGLQLLGPADLAVASLTVWPMGTITGDPVLPAQRPAVDFDPATAWTSGLPNHDFERCRWKGWKTRGSAFSRRTVTANKVFWGGILYNPSRNFQGRCHYTGYASLRGDRARGRAQSPHFELGGDGVINFLLAGGRDPEKLRVSLVRARDGARLKSATGIDYEEYQRVWWDASEHVGEVVFIELVDEATGGWGHLNFDDLHVPVARFVDATGKPE